jgi:hypothetical protein
VSKKNVHQVDVNMDERKYVSKDVEDLSMPSSKRGKRFSIAFGTGHVDVFQARSKFRLLRGQARQAQ